MEANYDSSHDVCLHADPIVLGLDTLTSHGYPWISRPTEVRLPVLGLDTSFVPWGTEEDWSCRLSGSSDGKVRCGRPHPFAHPPSTGAARPLCKWVQQAIFKGFIPLRPGAYFFVPSAVCMYVLVCRCHLTERNVAKKHMVMAEKSVCERRRLNLQNSRWSITNLYKKCNGIVGEIPSLPTGQIGSFAMNGNWIPSLSLNVPVGEIPSWAVGGLFSKTEEWLRNLQTRMWACAETASPCLRSTEGIMSPSHMLMADQFEIGLWTAATCCGCFETANSETYYRETIWDLLLFFRPAFQTLGLGIWS